MRKIAPASRENVFLLNCLLLEENESKSCVRIVLSSLVFGGGSAARLSRLPPAADQVLSVQTHRDKQTTVEGVVQEESTDSQDDGSLTLRN
jgi:hypothetical protein